MFVFNDIFVCVNHHSMPSVKRGNLIGWFGIGNNWPSEHIDVDVDFRCKQIILYIQKKQKKRKEQQLNDA